MLFLAAAPLLARSPAVLDGLTGVLTWYDDPHERVSSQTTRGKSTSSAVRIDGRVGTLWKGQHTNGARWYEAVRLSDKLHSLHGARREWNDQGQMIEETHWWNGALHGAYRRWYADGQLAEEAVYDRFRQQGTERFWYRSGQEKRRTNYRDGLREREFLAWHPNGAQQCRANFAHDQLHGPWQKWDVEGNLVRQATYRDGELVEETPARPTVPFTYPGNLGAGDFAFVLAQGSDWHGFNTLQVSAAGKCRYRYKIEQYRISQGESAKRPKKGERYIQVVWRETEFQLTDEMQRQLRRCARGRGLVPFAGKLHQGAGRGRIAVGGPPACRRQGSNGVLQQHVPGPGARAFQGDPRAHHGALLE